ncbi:hypothetical protein Ga0074812_12648 [Parafrankia irregularis]|uniref:Desulfoferrodoxin n=1 Tax=Parafrankia irregularis TaxID=795642 RepID=A0A0S4QUH0_9ACTN|nr:MULTISPECIES: desulfoferrodoxin [Parafrankia]MBE3199983.1 desulfoferrodoxin [Parafrankia sp. CH37]CUU59271.1 hypothetical protein Ga0074812_12648 [Parafrankia irregularis]
MADAPTAGARLRNEATGVEVILVKAPTEPGLEIRPGGPVAIGKRYTCPACAAQALVVKPGAGELVCHDAVMELAQARPLPSSD